MKLDVLKSTESPWYAEGLTFTCSQCGNCCTGGPGYVWLASVEIARLAKFLKIPRKELLEKYCRRIGERYSLKEIRTPQGMYDCVFLKEVATTHSGGVTGVKKICSVYQARPLQCRTWPFWDGNLAGEENWKSAGKRCHGIDAGARKFTREQIESLRDAKDWPENPPTSKA